jgi:hypothetical protein
MYFSSVFEFNPRGRSTEFPEEKYNMTVVGDYGRIAMKSTIAAGEFKTKCLKLLDEVAEKRQTLVITKYGKAVAQVVPMPVKQRNIVGAMKGSNPGRHYLST